MKTKKLLLFVLTIILALASISLVACGNGAGSTDGEKLSDAGFKEGYAINYVVGEKIVIADLVDNQGASFKLTASKKGEKTIDLTSEKDWKLNKVGTWTFNLKIQDGEKKGEYGLSIFVKGPSLSMEFAGKGLRYSPNENVEFETIIKDLDISTNMEGYGEYRIRVFSIQLMGQNTEIVKFSESDTGYTFPSKGNYRIIFGIESEDGQLIKNYVEVTVK